MAVWLLATPSYGAVVIANSGGVTAGALARVDGGGILASNSNSDGFTGAVRSLKSGITVSSRNSAQQIVSSTTTATASFLSADAGSVFVNLSRDFTGVGTSGAQNNQGNAGPINFFYSFTPTINAILKLTSNVSVQGGNPFGFQGFLLRANGNAVLGNFNAINPTTSGSTIVNLDRGILYTLTIENASNISGGLPSLFSGSATGEFNFAIAGVPEPETWAMMIIGFGLIGGAARRRKTSIRVAYN
ncbi:MAG: PEPxxWA-CTERM sorting domain-containing protein [Pseudomonadota bacterium]